MVSAIPYDELLTDAQNCFAEMETLLAACENDFRRRPHQYMNLPHAASKIRRAIKRRILDEGEGELPRWHVIKRCQSLVSLDCVFTSLTSEQVRKEVKALLASAMDNVKAQDRLLQRRAEDERKRDQKLRREIEQQVKTKARVHVDVVDNGYEWISVRALMPKALATQMTESGWSWGCYDDEDEGDCDVPYDEYEDVSLTKRVKLLIAAAKLNPHEYATPRIRLVLPNIGRENADFAVLFDHLAHLDPEVPVIIEDKNSPFLARPPPSNYISNLMGDPLAELTPTITLDHTAIVDIISDLTHLRLEPQPWQYIATKTQIVEENSYEGGLMAKWIYPVLPGRRLVITKHTAEHLYEILATVGTATERERARLLVPFPGEERSLSDAEALSRFQALSIHQLPEGVQIPIEIDPRDWLSPSVILEETQAGRLPAINTKTTLLNDYNLATIIRGWALNSTVVTSNREMKTYVRKWILQSMPEGMKIGTGEATEPREEKTTFRPPTIYTLQVARYMLSSHATPREGDVKGSDELE